MEPTVLTEQTGPTARPAIQVPRALRVLMEPTVQTVLTALLAQWVRLARLEPTAQRVPPV